VVRGGITPSGTLTRQVGSPTPRARGYLRCCGRKNCGRTLRRSGRGPGRGGGIPGVFEETWGVGGIVRKATRVPPCEVSCK